MIDLTNDKLRKCVSQQFYIMSRVCKRTYEQLESGELTEISNPNWGTELEYKNQKKYRLKLTLEEVTND